MKITRASVARPSGRASKRSVQRPPSRSGYCTVHPTRTLAILIIALVTIATVSAQTKPDKDYFVYVVSESADRIALIRFGPNGARIDHQLETDFYKTEPPK